jgi:hypothetical protein
MAALSFQQPDIVPRFEGFWSEFADAWREVRQAQGVPAGRESPERHYGIDIAIAVADETPWPSQAAVLSRDDGVVVHRNPWGQVIRERPDAKFFQEIAVAVPDRVDPDTLTFESSALDGRYARFFNTLPVAARHDPRIFAMWGPIPHLQPARIEQWLVDIAEAPVSPLGERVTDHLIQGTESAPSQPYETESGSMTHRVQRGRDGGPATRQRLFTADAP